MKQFFVLVLFLVVLVRGYSQKPDSANQLSERYWYLIESPHSPQAWDCWRNGLKEWKDSLMHSVHYDERYYTDPKYQWASKAYSTFFLMANDRSLYDSAWNYDIKKCLGRYEKEFGGVDIVLLWATYPQLGFDNRDQYTFYRNLPGGIRALKKLCDEIHAMGKKFFIAYNPWDQIARNNGKTDEEELMSLVRETGADGIFLDTISGVAGFRKKLDDAAPGVVFQSEMSPDPATLSQVQQSWMEIPVWNESFKNAEYDDVPFIIRSRWLDQRHMVYHLSRWSHEQSNIIQNAWMNGCGVVVWENVFGTMNELNARDRSLLRSMLPLMRRYSDFFAKGKWTPLYPTHLGRTYSSCWELDHQKMWTIINRGEQPAMGPLLEIKHEPGTKYYDLINGKEANTRIDHDKAWITVDLKPRAIGCILALNEKDINPDFISFMQEQAQSASRYNSNTSYQLPSHILKPIAPTKKYPLNQIPSGMIQIGVPSDSFPLPIHFRQRECGFYPAEGVTDISYTMTLDQPGMAIRKIKLNAYAMDETPVTNAEFLVFLKASRYHPAFPENFLKHWINGHPVKGEEDHPVVWISLDDARAYAAWSGKRLPTEEEWQWAAQSEDKTFLYPWGNQYDSACCNHGQTNHTSPVKEFKTGRTEQGLYDMCGNVWQFTESERNDGHNDYCILRGGSWYSTKGSGWYADQGPQQTNFASKYLFTWPGLDRCATIGFRCVVDTNP
jgi:gamma-glutamyl hercynylcysteine S-oxide synthase